MQQNLAVAVVRKQVPCDYLEVIARHHCAITGPDVNTVLIAVQIPVNNRTSYDYVRYQTDRYTCDMLRYSQSV